MVGVSGHAGEAENPVNVLAWWWRIGLRIRLMIGEWMKERIRLMIGLMIGERIDAMMGEKIRVSIGLRIGFVIGARIQLGI